MTSSLGLRGQTATALQSFKKRNDDARRKIQALSELPQAVDFDHYRNTLKNQAVVDDIEAQFKNFKPATYDVSRQLKAIDAFESQAVQNAEQTKGKVETELVNLKKTLDNIETARPFEDLTVVRDGWDCCGLIVGSVLTCLSLCFRMRSLPLSLRLMRRPLPWSPRASGCRSDTRCVFSHVSRDVFKEWYVLIRMPILGALRRPCCSLSGSNIHVFLRLLYPTTNLIARRILLISNSTIQLV